MTDEIMALLDEVRLLFHRAAQTVEDLHRGERITAAMRAVLEVLDGTGPATVPDIARRRHVSRQHIQVVVNALMAENLVAVQDNPAHRRSPLVSLAPTGKLMIKRMKRREQRLLARLAVPATPDELAGARHTLRAVREALGEARVSDEKIAVPPVR